MRERREERETERETGGERERKRESERGRKREIDRDFWYISNKKRERGEGFLSTPLSPSNFDTQKTETSTLS